MTPPTRSPWPDTTGPTTDEPFNIGDAGTLAAIRIEITRAIHRGQVKLDWKGIARAAVRQGIAAGIVTTADQ